MAVSNTLTMQREADAPLPEGARPQVMALIPARGGSKGIPRKNIRLLNGKPLIAYSIEAALEAKLVDRVVVSTDDEEIAEVARQYGAEVPFLRPPELATDTAALQPCIAHARQEMKRLGFEPQVIATLFPTHPFKSAALIDYLVNKCLGGYSPVVTVKKVVHGQQSIFARREGILVPLLEDTAFPGTSTSKTFYRNYGLVNVQRMDGKVKPYNHVLTSELELIDIDDERDLQLATQLLQEEEERNSSPVSGQAGSTVPVERSEPMETQVPTLLLVPVMVNGHKRWFATRGVALLERFVKAAREHPGLDRVVVVTNSRLAASVARANGADALCDELAVAGQEGAGGPLPPGTELALDILKAGGATAPKICLAMDYRYPESFSEALDGALATVHGSGRAALSVALSEDHPCQLSSFYRLVNGGFLAAVAQGATLPPALAQGAGRAAELLSSHAFAYDWKRHDALRPAPGSLLVHTGESGAGLVHCPPGSDAPDRIETALYCVDGKTAVALWSRSLLSGLPALFRLDPQEYEIVAALPLVRAMGQTTALARRKGDGRLILCSRAAESGQAMSLRVMTVRDKTAHGGEKDGVFAVEPFQGRHELARETEVAPLHGLVFSLLAMGEDSGFDYKEGFRPSLALWQGRSGKCLSLDGKFITGRQAFPDVHEPDRRAALIPGLDAALAASAIADGQAEGFELPLTPEVVVSPDASLPSPLQPAEHAGAYAPGTFVRIQGRVQALRDALDAAEQAQREGAQAFFKEYHSVMNDISEMRQQLQTGLDIFTGCFPDPLEGELLGAPLSQSLNKLEYEIEQGFKRDMADRLITSARQLAWSGDSAQASRVAWDVLSVDPVNTHARALLAQVRPGQELDDINLRFVATFRHERMQNPFSVAMNSKTRRIYISDCRANAVFVFEPSGAFVEIIEQGFQHAAGLIAAEDDVWLCDYGNHRLVRLPGPGRGWGEVSFKGSGASLGGQTQPLYGCYGGGKFHLLFFQAAVEAKAVASFKIGSSVPEQVVPLQSCVATGITWHEDRLLLGAREPARIVSLATQGGAPAMEHVWNGGEVIGGFSFSGENLFVSWLDKLLKFRNKQLVYSLELEDVVDAPVKAITGVHALQDGSSDLLALCNKFSHCVHLLEV